MPTGQLMDAGGGDAGGGDAGGGDAGGDHMSHGRSPPLVCFRHPCLSSQRGVNQLGNEEVSEVLLTQCSHL